MKTLSAEPLFHIQNELGEGPVWHPIEKCLYWVDIAAGDLYQSNSELTGFTKTHFNTQIGAFGFVKEGGFILATTDGFSTWKPGQPEPEVFWNPLPPREGIRLNDGKVGPGGRFWAGSMDSAQSKGEFYCIKPDGSHQVMLSDIGISNGLGWSPDRKTMYYTDSIKYTIYAFDFDLETGAITNQRPFVELPNDSREIVPDGLCVDAEGCIWNAHWNGWEVVRYDPQGTPILRVKVPAQRVTSCFFGGEKGDQLFITSACGKLSQEALEKQPYAGGVFICQTDTQGQRVNFFG
jgi:sugar lactone lactonase YvrE